MSSAIARRSVVVVLLLLVAATSVAAQAAGQPTTLSPSVSPSASAKDNTGTEYYPPGKSYDDDPNAAVDYTMKDGDYVESGESTTFMTMSTPAQIGIIVGVIMAAVGLFVGSVMFYLRRRRQWEIRKSMTIAPKKASIISSSTGNRSSGDPEHGISTQTVHVKSEFETDQPPQTPTWKRWMPRA